MSYQLSGHEVLLRTPSPYTVAEIFGSKTYVITDDVDYAWWEYSRALQELGKAAFKYDQTSPIKEGRECPACVHKRTEHDGYGCLKCSSYGLPCAMPHYALVRSLYAKPGEQRRVIPLPRSDGQREDRSSLGSPERHDPARTLSR